MGVHCVALFLRRAFDQPEKRRLIRLAFDCHGRQSLRFYHAQGRSKRQIYLCSHLDCSFIVWMLAGRSIR